jgi:hypothetical protein
MFHRTNISSWVQVNRSIATLSLLHRYANEIGRGDAE